jgi:hypothetical protein
MAVILAWCTHDLSALHTWGLAFATSHVGLVSMCLCAAFVVLPPKLVADNFFKSNFLARALADFGMCTLAMCSSTLFALLPALQTLPCLSSQTRGLNSLTPIAGAGGQSFDFETFLAVSRLIPCLSVLPAMARASGFGHRLFVAWHRARKVFATSACSFRTSSTKRTCSVGG